MPHSESRPARVIASSRFRITTVVALCLVHLAPFAPDRSFAQSPDALNRRPPWVQIHGSSGIPGDALAMEIEAQSTLDTLVSSLTEWSDVPMPERVSVDFETCRAFWISSGSTTTLLGLDAHRVSIDGFDHLRIVPRISDEPIEEHTPFVLVVVPRTQLPPRIEMQRVRDGEASWESVPTLPSRRYGVELRIRLARHEMRAIGMGCVLFEIDHGRAPTSPRELYTPSGGDEIAYLVGGDGLDPWKNPYVFLPRPGQLPKIVSYGADGKEGGTGDDADLVHDPDA